MIDTGMSFGGYLRRQRQQIGMSLGEVARRIHVRWNVLRLVEAEDHSRLPDPLFVRSFIRAYARMVEADADHAVALFNTSRASYLAALQLDADVDRYVTGYGRRLMACLSGVMMVVVFEIVFMYWAGPIGNHPQAAANGQLLMAGSTDGSSLMGPSDGSEQGEKHRLLITARQTTWMSISLDGKPSREYRLLAGDRLEMDALRTIDLLIGNAQGVDLVFNRTPVAVVGQSGQVVRLHLP